MSRSLEDMAVGETAYIHSSSLQICNLDIMFYERRWILPRTARIFTTIADEDAGEPACLVQVRRQSLNVFDAVIAFKEAIPTEESVRRVTDGIRLGAYFEHVTVFYDPQLLL